MAKTKKKKRVIPKSYIYLDKDDHPTVAVRRKDGTGRFDGRRRSKKGDSDDKVRPLRVMKGKWGGTVVGTATIPVKASPKKRATVRRRID